MKKEKFWWILKFLNGGVGVPIVGYGTRWEESRVNERYSAPDSNNFRLLNFKNPDHGLWRADHAPSCIINQIHIDNCKQFFNDATFQQPKE